MPREHESPYGHHVSAGNYPSQEGPDDGLPEVEQNALLEIGIHLGSYQVLKREVGGDNASPKGEKKAREQKSGQSAKRSGRQAQRRKGPPKG